MPPRRILFIDHTAKLSGGEIALFNLVRQLDRSKYEPVVLLYSDGKLRQKMLDAGIETHLLPLDARIVETRKDSLNAIGLAKLGTVLRVFIFAIQNAKFIRQHRIDLIHANSLKSDVIAGIAGRLARRPVIWHIRDRIDEDYLPRKATILFRLLCRILPDAIIANSNATLSTLKLPPLHQTEAIHSGIDLRERSRVVHDGTGPATRDLFRQPGEHHIAGRKVGLVGRITHWKGQHVFLQAAQWVHQQFPNVRFQIVGSAMFAENAYEGKLHELVKKLGLSTVVDFTGFREDISAIVGDLDILVHASVNAEPFGQVVIEGMAMGKPVVATAGGGVLEIVEDGVTGLLVPMGDAAAMANAICRLLANPEMAACMGAMGQRRVQEDFTIELTADRVERFYEAVLQQPSAWRRLAYGILQVRPDVPRAGMRWLARAAGMAATIALATVISLLLQMRYGESAPLLGVYFIAVIGVARSWGSGAGYLTLVLSLLAVDFFVMEPHESWSHQAVYTPQLWMLLAGGAIATHLVGKVQLLNQHLRASAASSSDAHRDASDKISMFRSFSFASDPPAIAETIAYLANKHITQWCAVDLVTDEGKMRRAAVTAARPEDAMIARQWQQTFGKEIVGGPAIQVWKKAAAELIDLSLKVDRVAGEDLLTDSNVNPAQALLIPMIGPSGVMGVATFIRSVGSEPFDSKARQLAADLCRAASLRLWECTKSSPFMPEASNFEDASERLMPSWSNRLLAASSNLI